MPIEATKVKVFDSHLTGEYFFCDSVLKLKEDKYYNEKHLGDSLFTDKDSFNTIHATISILPKKVYYEGKLKFYYNIKKLDTLNIIPRHKHDKRIIQNNFLIFEGTFADTIIDLTKRDKLRSYKGKYYLNHFIEEHDWEIYKLELIQDSMLSIRLVNNQDEEKLKPYLITRSRILGNIAHLSDMEFYNFIEKGGFRTRYNFKKQLTN